MESINKALTIYFLQAFLPPIKMLVAMLILPLAMGQMGAPTNLQSMSYSIVNGKVFVDPPTTPAPTFMETWSVQYTQLVISNICLLFDKICFGIILILPHRE